MAITLQEAKKNVQDSLTMGVIDEFAKSNFLLNNLTFDDAVSPTGGGATLTYAYTRLKTQPNAGFREINSEYTPSDVSKERHSVDLKVFGGSFEIDRIIAGMGGIIGEVSLQMAQKIKAAQALFNDTVINGDSATDAKVFDGLEKALAGSSTEYQPNIIDLSDSTAIEANYKIFLDEMDNFLANLDGRPTALLVNRQAWAKVRACARRSSMFQQTMDSFGRNIDMYDGIPLIDLGEKSGTNDMVISTNGGLTSIYAVRLGLDGFHGVSMAGQSPVRTWLPDFNTAGAVKKGEVEMVAAVALKATKAAGVMRKIKVM